MRRRAARWAKDSQARWFRAGAIPPSIDETEFIGPSPWVRALLSAALPQRQYQLGAVLVTRQWRIAVAAAMDAICEACGARRP
jgi:hypothetical protein